MTINVLLETLLGKSCLLEGTFGDATPFTSNSTNIAEKLCDRLQSNGYERHGWEELISGFTGEPIKAKIFTGPTFYQRLKHMVKDKIHSRSSGDVTLLTRQPLEGRSRDGQGKLLAVVNLNFYFIIYLKTKAVIYKWLQKLLIY
jgi:DNA-directed RNA polymerase II subunit RPB2